MARVLIVKSRRETSCLMELRSTVGSAAGESYDSVRAVARSNVCPSVNVTTAVPNRSWMVTRALYRWAKAFAKRNPIAFDDQVQVKAPDAKEEISDEPAYGIHADVASFSEFTGFLQGEKKVVRTTGPS